MQYKLTLPFFIYQNGNAIIKEYYFLYFNSHENLNNYLKCLKDGIKKYSKIEMIEEGKI